MPAHHSRHRLVARLARAMVLLQARHTRAQLAASLGVSDRTARRYIDSLEEGGLTIRRYGPHYQIARQP